MTSPAPPTPARKPSYTIERRQTGPVSHVWIRGTIDETLSTKKLADTLVGHVLIDLGRVERISSFGVRQWMQLTQQLPLGALGLYLLHAPPVLVDQLNMVEGFAGIAQVLSVLAPYACDKCGEERVRVVDLRTAGPLLAEGKVPEFNCPSCESPLRFADQADEYFSFVKQHPVNGLEASVERYLNSLIAPRATDHVNSVKLVEEDVTYVRMPSTIRGDLSVRRLSSGLEGTVVYDFGGVAEIEPAGIKKIREVLAAAAATASVVLWRLPPIAVGALETMEAMPNVAIANLWLPCECASCGSGLFQAVSAASYLRTTTGDGSERRACGVCGAQVQVPRVEGASKLLAEHPATDVPYEKIEAVEPKAASQVIHGAALPDPNTPTSSSGARTSQTGLKAVPEKDAPNQNLHLLKHLGRGGMAEVFLARQVGLKGFEKYVTVKRILPQFAQSPDFVEMLFAEARANARLTHPNVVQLFDVGSLDGVAHLTMEYVRGPDFKRVLVMARKSGSSLPVPHALRIVAETAAGLHYAHTFVDPMGHSHPVIHRDVSPHNILVSLDGAVKLSDFGIAKVSDGGEGTRPGTFKGKIHYSSPEQIRGLPLDARHDLFSLGIVLFEALTGFLPFRAENDVATLTAIAQTPVADPRQAVPSLPEDVCELVFRALEKSPDERFQSAGEFREAIEEVMARHGYRSSPIDVSHYVRDLLGEHLKDFSPASIAEVGGPRSNSNPLLAIAQSPSQLTPTGGEPGGASQAGQPKTGVVSRPSAPRAPGATPSGGVARALRPSGLMPAPGPTRPSGLTPAPGPTRPSGLTPRPSGSTPVPGPAARPSGSLSRPSPQSGSLPKVAPADGSDAGPLLVAELVAVAEAPPAPRRRVGPLIFGGLVVVAAAVGGGLLLMPRGEAQVEIANLQANEQLFISGVEVDPLTLAPQQTEAPVVVSVAVGGALKRMGTAKVGKVLDLQPLFEASASPGQTARLTVSSAEPGCPVEIDGTPAKGSTPLTANVAAGEVLELKVLCEGKPAWVRKILAAPGQQLDISTAPPQR